MRLGLAGPSPAVDAVAGNLTPDEWDVVRFDTPEDLIAGIENREAAGGLVFAADGVDVYTATAGGAPGAAAVTALGTSIAQRQQVPVRTHELVAFPADDPRGAGLTAAALPMVFGGLIPAIALTQLFPGRNRLLLRFVQALSASSEVRAESFVFGTRLTRVTRLLRDKDRDRALSRVSEAVNDWAGGTRIGESFRMFNQHWARRSLRSSGVVIVVSDGWDRGDPNLVATETARLRRNCHRLVWLNPLAGTPGYQPLAGGMRAAYPYIDDFLPAGTVASLERLGEILGGVRSADTRQGAEAAAHAALPVADLTAVPPPSVVGGTPTDPTTARPIR